MKRIRNTPCVTSLMTFAEIRPGECFRLVDGPTAWQERIYMREAWIVDAHALPAIDLEQAESILDRKKVVERLEVGFIVVSGGA